MAAPALAVGAYLVQTRLPNAKCTIESKLGVANLHRFKIYQWLAPLSIQAVRRGSQTPRPAVLLEAQLLTTHALELDSGKRTRRI